MNNTWTPGQAMTGGYINKYMNINTWKRNRIQLTESTLTKVRHDDDTKRDIIIRIKTWYYTFYWGMQTINYSSKFSTW